MSEVSAELLESQHEAIMDQFLPLDFRTPGLTSYADITDCYLRSAWGVHHAGQAPRFALAHGYDPSQMLVDLGLSVDPVHHGRVAHNDFQTFMLVQAGLTMEGLDMSPQHIAASRFGAITHDYGENTHDDFLRIFGRVVGDKERGTKTAEDQAVETGILSKIHEVLYGGLPVDFRQYGLSLVRRLPPVAGSMAARLRDLSHEWGEYRTTLWAGQLAVQLRDGGETEGLRVQRLATIGKQCAQVVRASLEDESETFPYLVRLLEGTDRVYQSTQAAL